MKRTQLKRKNGLTRSRSKRKVPAWKLEDLPRALFREAARTQRVFHQPGCRTHGKAHAHHVLYEQHAKRAGANPHDRRNALRICPCCHYAHHHNGRKIPTRALPDDALAFTFEVLGAAAIDYFRRYYADADLDARVLRRFTDASDA